ncbi:Na+/H+ antiporter NhaA [Dokdonella koreensis]|uniref:Na(+)/H(+) antiporter NhaA n=1 Tax=Dokdonella koreensis DS-123 TaxID=1300342 RepID=A0A160DX41_9GAMM|nr:Na+/H+ antiporter NhaA [Dokdonella koreensis]ANB19064.1 Na(+)/H(+) antiporter NhaA [Dokdonella koreensis DS-123]
MSWSPIRRIRDFMDGEAAGGLVLMAAAAAALVIANSPWSDAYFAALAAYLGPLSVLHWINDGLMAVFFLLVGLEIKREVLNGELATARNRVLPGVAAVGGMLVPALIYAGFNLHDAAALKGWAVPTATDIAFALGVLSLLGNRVPVSLKVFLTALAIIDDLGAVIIIALFYTGGLSPAWLAAALGTLVLLGALNRFGVARLWPYLVLGVLLWVLVLRSGVHATLAGVALALLIPLRQSGSGTAALASEHSPLLRLEHALHRVVPFLIIPIFGFANAGLSFAGLSPAALVEPLTLGVAGGLLVGKVIGVFGFSALAIRCGVATLPHGARWIQLFGVALLCGIGFTMSLFIGLLAFADAPLLQSEVKVGILCGSFLAGLSGWAVLRWASPGR